MGESEDSIYRIHFCGDLRHIEDTDYSVAIRGENVVLALTHPFDRSQHWMKDERHGATIKDSEGQPAFALINRATGQAISHGPNSQPTIHTDKINLLSLVRYNTNSCDKSVLWTMSEEDKGSRIIRRWDNISVCFKSQFSFVRYEGQLIYSALAQSQDHLRRSRLISSRDDINWKFEKVSPFTFVSLFRPSQHTVKIICELKVGYNLAIDKDGSTVLLVPSNPKDKYQHWIKEMAYGVPVRYEGRQNAFALVNMATGKAIKHGFGKDHFVQVAPFNRNYMDPSLLWRYRHGFDFKEISMLTDRSLGFNITKISLFLVLSSVLNFKLCRWKIEDFE